MFFSAAFCATTSTARGEPLRTPAIYAASMYNSNNIVGGQENRRVFCVLGIFKINRNAL